MFTRAFLYALLERAVKTFAQTAAAMLVAADSGLLDADWITVVSVAGMAAVVSVLTSVGSGAATGTPSLASEVLPYTPEH